MPRDSNGDYSLPAGNPVSTNTPIAISWANGTMSDIASVLTASLDRSGNGGMLAPLELDSGAVGAPGLTFGAETTLGLYRVSAGVLGVAAGGVKLAEFDSTGLEVTTGVFIAPSGTAALPGVSFTGDLNTGMSAAAADTLVLSTGGTARLTLTSALATFAPVIGAPAGTAALPGISFSGDLNTGFSAATADTLIASVAGAAGWTLTSASFALAVPVLGPAGSAAAPAYSFNSAGNDDGMYLIANNQLGFATLGTLRFTITNAALTSTEPFLGPNGSVSEPTFSFSGDADTGLYLPSADELGFTLGGVGYLVGYRNLPDNNQNGNYTAVLSDNGKMIRKSAGGVGETYTIPANASVAFQIGDVLTFVNVGGGALTIAITTDTLTWAADGSTGSRTLADNGVATAIKVNTTEWLISGTGLS